MLPEGWKKISLADAVSQKISYGIVQAGPHVNGGVPYIKSSDVRDDISLASLQRTSAEIHKKYIRSSVHPGDIVFSLRGNIGATCIVPSEISEANLTQGTARISCSQKVYPNFLIQELRTSSCIQQALNLSKGSTFKEISLESLRTLKVIIPPLPEQKKIAAILSTWDRAIAGTEKLLANSQQQKKALMQQLLTGKKRLPGFTGEWNIRKFQDLFHERTETEREDLPLLSVTANDGVIFQEDSGRKDISKEDKSKYKRICVGDIGYNTMRMWQGRSCFSNKEGIVSPAYTIVFAKKNICTIFASYLFKFPPMIHVFYRHSQGLVSDTWNLKFKHFKEISWEIPPLSEQKAIAAVLTTADEEITTLESDLTRLRQEKKALMQQLLTGKRRVTVD